MDKCKFCQAEMAENGTFCPVCGKNNAEETFEEVTVSEIPTEETIAAQEEAFLEEMPEPKASAGKIAIAVVAVVVLAAVLVALLFGGMNKPADTAGETVPVETTEAVSEETVTVTEATVPADGNPDDVTCKGTYTAADEDVMANADTVVATAGDFQLTNSQLQIYYWLEVQSFLQNYGSYAYYFGLDYTQPLDTQVCSMLESGTWQQFFLDRALQSWQNYKSMAFEADINGFTLREEDQTYLDGLAQSLADSAVANGFESAEALLAYNVGNGSKIEDYVSFNRDYLKGYQYYQEMVESIVLTDEEITEYFQANAATYAEQEITEETKFVDVRHILFMPEGGTVGEDGTTTYSEEEWEAARVEAQAVLDQWLAGDKSEDSFAALVNEYTDDGNDANQDGVPDGGLYTDVYVGQMVPEFENWCFDEARQVGDSGLVKTTYGYHVMYFVGSKLAWKVYA